MYTIETEEFWTLENEMERFLLEYNQNTQPVLIYGAGKGADWVIRLLRILNIPIEHIIDQNKGAGEKNGVPIIEFQEIEKIYGILPIYILNGAPKYEREIVTLLKSHFNNNNIYSFECELYFSYIHNLDEYRLYLKANREVLLTLMNSLEDEKSKKTLNNILLGRITGKLEYFREVYVPDQYFDKEIVEWQDNEVILDIGACIGDTVEQIMDLNSDKIKRIYCFEPDYKCLESLRENIAALKNDIEIEIVPKGAWDKKETLYFESDSAHGASKIVEGKSGTYEIQLDTIDNIVGNNEIITHIKMDIEGAELLAIHGAENTIKRCKPRLAICVYHKNEDIIQISKYIQKLVPEYKLYLRHHNISGTETVLYAVL